MIAVIGPGYATSILKIEVERFPLLFVTPAVIGMAAGAIVIGNFLHTKPKDLLTKIGLLIIGIVFLFFPHISFVTSKNIVISLNTTLPYLLDINIIHMLLIMAIIIGFAFSLVFVPSNTILQEETTDEQRGKIYGSLNTMVGLVSIIPVLGVGALADLIGVGRVITIIGISIIGISILRFLKYK